MEKYRQKTAFASFSDHVLRVALAVALGVGWFVYLWGLSLPAITAGLAMGGLLWLCARLFGKKSVEKREAAMRRMLGGEMALDKLLLLPPRHAAFQAALWLTPKAPLEMHKAVDWGVLGVLNGKRALIRLIAQHKSLPITVQQIIEVVKEQRAHQAERCLLCVTAPLSREALTYAEAKDIRVVQRDELIGLAGLCSPATDEELSQLKKRKRKRRSVEEWTALVLSPGRAKRYFWYGAGLAVLALFTGQSFYPVPAVLCLILFAGCKLRQHRVGQAQW